MIVGRSRHATGPFVDKNGIPMLEGSGTLLLDLARKGLTREDAYALVQGHAMDTWKHGGDFRQRVLADPRITEVLTKEEVDRAFSLDEALRHVEAIFERSLTG